MPTVTISQAKICVWSTLLPLHFSSLVKLDRGPKINVCRESATLATGRRPVVVPPKNDRQPGATDECDRDAATMVAAFRPVQRWPGREPAQILAGKHQAPPPECVGVARGSSRARAPTHSVPELFTAWARSAPSTTTTSCRRRSAQPLAPCAAPQADRIGGSAPGPSGAICHPL